MDTIPENRIQFRAWNDYETEELKGILSDYHKDVFGYRPSPVSFTNRETIIDELGYLDAYMAKMKSTSRGREKLREDGWDIWEG